MQHREVRVGLFGQADAVRQRPARSIREIDGTQNSLEWRRRRLGDGFGGASWDDQRWTRRLAQHSLGDRTQQEPLDSGPTVTSHDDQVGVNHVDPIEDLATDIGGFCDHQVERHVAQWMTGEPLQLGEQPRTIPVGHADRWQIDHCEVG